MNLFGEYLRNRREQLGLPLRKVAAELDIDTSILSKIERNERVATKEMLPTLAKTLEVQEKEIQIEFIQSTILSELGDLEFLTDGLKNVLKKTRLLCAYFATGRFNICCSTFGTINTHYIWDFT